jgi:hypothetical protein
MAQPLFFPRSAAGRPAERNSRSGKKGPARPAGPFDARCSVGSRYLGAMMPVRPGIRYCRRCRRSDPGS